MKQAPTMQTIKGHFQKLLSFTSQGSNTKISKELLYPSGIQIYKTSTKRHQEHWHSTEKQQDCECWHLMSSWVNSSPEEPRLSLAIRMATTVKNWIL